MKIAFVSQPFDGVLPPRQNSVGHLIYGLTGHLARCHDITVFTGGGRIRKKYKRVKGVEYQFIPAGPDVFIMKVLRMFSVFRNVKRPVFSSWLYRIVYILQISFLLRSGRYDIVHLFNFSQFAFFVRTLNPKAKIVLRMSCEWLTQLDRDMIERRLRHVDRIIGCSDYITDKIRGSFPDLAERCRTVLNGRDIKYFTPANGSRVSGDSGARLLYVGRVSPEKGVHVLLDAFQKVSEYYPGVRLRIIGGKGQLPYEYLVAMSDNSRVRDLAVFYNGNSRQGYFSLLQRRINQSVMEDRVIFTGPVPHSELIEYYRDADIFVFPSVWDEPSGNPPVEAMSAGVPVVSTRTGGTPEYVEDGKTGILVEPGNSEELAKAILRLLDNEDLRKRMGEAGRRRAEEYFSFEKAAENLLHEYRELATAGQT